MAYTNSNTYVSNFNADDQASGIKLQTDERGHQYALSQLFAGETLGDSLKVSPATNSSMNISIESGYAQIPFNDYAYQCWLDTDATMTLDGADQSLNRISYIVAYIDRGHTFTESVKNNPGLMYIMEIKGSDASNPEPPSAAQIQSTVGANNPYILLAQIYVPANATIITLSNVTDLRTKISLQDGIKLPTSSYSGGVMQASGSTTSNPLKLAVINYGSQLPAAEQDVDMLICEISQ